MKWQNSFTEFGAKKLLLPTKIICLFDVNNIIMKETIIRETNQHQKQLIYENEQEMMFING